MTDLDPAAIMGPHQPYEAPHDYKCRGCADAWPCLPYRLAAEVAALREQARWALRNHGHAEACTCCQPDDDTGICDCWRAALAGEGAADQPQPEVQR